MSLLDETLALANAVVARGHTGTEAHRLAEAVIASRAAAQPLPPPKGRAVTAQMKNRCMIRLLRAWHHVPEQRLGQLINNALSDAARRRGEQVPSLATREDNLLLSDIEGLCRADVRTNGGVVCDVTNGPCACGAWHDL